MTSPPGPGRFARRAGNAPEPASPVRHALPVVGIGASAGGLEALEQFLRHVPAGCQAAFVVVQHLDPTREGLMVELLQKATSMPVTQITDRLAVESGQVYVIPAGQDLSILNGVLHLLAPAEPRGQRLPVDHFLRSLADDQQERAIGVILSGMGADGTLGLRAIKDKAGAVFVQSEASAKFDGMPGSAIDAGLADVVAPAEELGPAIQAYLLHVGLLGGQPGGQPSAPDSGSLDGIIALLRTGTGHDFSQYKKSTLIRRVDRRMALHRLQQAEQYLALLRDNPQETSLLFKELLIGVTSFFRDPEVWEQVKAEVVPGLVAAHPGGAAFRAWTPGCSTGEEAYTLAMVFLEALETIKPAARYTLQIFATDLDPDAVARARNGIYPISISADVSTERLRLFFTETAGGFKVGRNIREMVTFAPQNLVMDPPFTRLDILVCRNLLIYLELDLQKKLLPLFHYSLNPGGALVLGTSESVGTCTDLFAALPGRTRLYRKTERRQARVLPDFPAGFGNHRRRAATGTPTAAAQELPPAAGMQSIIDGLLLQRFAPAAVLVSTEGDIIYISGKTGHYLEPAAGKANLNIFAMAREGLVDALSPAFATALRENTPIVLRDVRVGPAGDAHDVHVSVTPLLEPPELAGTVMIVFSNAVKATTQPRAGRPGRAGDARARIAALARELQQCRDDFQLTREEMRGAQEELKSTNEELQSTNEELQSTNEELTTSREEMQSMNEELHTVNHELQIKVDALSRAGDDMKNLLESTGIATLFLDAELRVRSFTTPTTQIIRLLPGDAGRPVTDLASALDYPGMAADAREVLRTLVPHEHIAPAGDGRRFRVCTLPYRTHAGAVDGLVITFMNLGAVAPVESNAPARGAAGP